MTHGIIYIDKTNMRYYRVFDRQTGDYFSTGYNSTSKKELIEKFKNYILIADEDVSKSSINTWAKIEDWLQGVELEKSNIPFENICK